MLPHGCCLALSKSLFLPGLRRSPGSSFHHGSWPHNRPPPPVPFLASLLFLASLQVPAPLTLAWALISSGKPLPHAEPTAAPRRRLIKIDEELPLIGRGAPKTFPHCEASSEAVCFHPCAGAELPGLLLASGTRRTRGTRGPGPSAAPWGWDAGWGSAPARTGCWGARRGRQGAGTHQGGASLKGWGRQKGNGKVKMKTMLGKKEG